MKRNIKNNIFQIIILCLIIIPILFLFFTFIILPTYYKNKDLTIKKATIKENPQTVFLCKISGTVLGINDYYTIDENGNCYYTYCSFFDEKTEKRNSVNPKYVQYCYSIVPNKENVTYKTKKHKRII